MPSLRKVKAIANLGVHFWGHVFRRVFMKPKPGQEKAKFKEYYRDDRIVELDGDDRAALLNYQKCINCGTCASVCPVYGPSAHGQYRAPDSIAGSLSRSFPEFGAARDAVFNCTQCGACAAQCPTGTDVPGLVMHVRRKMFQADSGAVRGLYSERMEAFEKCGNSHGAGAEKFDDFKKEKAEYVFFVGCAGGVLSSKETATTLELLRRIGVDFTVVSDTCCGGFLRSAGMLEGEDSTVRAAIDKIRAAGTNKVITACPHGLFTMLNHPEYKMSIEPVHILQLLAKLDFECAHNREPVTYHDPCFLGRRCGVLDDPRMVIARTGAKLIEMPRSRERSYCCGSLEGEYIVDEAVARAMAAERMAEAKATGAGVLLTACSSCTRALSQADDELPVMSVAEFILRRLKD